MKNFQHVNAGTIEEAVTMLETGSNSMPISGGTDLLPQMKLGVLQPDLLVNLKTIPGLNAVRLNGTTLYIGTLATLDAVASNEIVKDRCAALFQAIESAASPQLRNRGTVGGNLVQGSRCWYYRGDFNCWLKQGAVCYARDGENSRHAIFAGGPCFTVHPSDMAPALIALGAQVDTAGAYGSRTMRLEDFFQIPEKNSRRLTVLEPGEIITGIRIPAFNLDCKSIYIKQMERKVWSFALVSVAVNLTMEDEIVKDAKIVLGGVAPKPWRVPEAEAALRGNKLTHSIIERVASLAVQRASPLSQNRYKVTLAKASIIEALSKI